MPEISFEAIAIRYSDVVKNASVRTVPSLQ